MWYPQKTWEDVAVIYAEIKNPEDKQQLDDELLAAQEKKWYRRLIIISLSAQRYSVKELSEMFKLSEATIRRYIHAYNRDGISGLNPNKSPGRPRKISHWTMADWDKVLERTPDRYDLFNIDYPPSKPIWD